MSNRILFIAPTPFFSDRGCHVRILEEAKALKSKGNSITIATYHIGKDIKGFDIRRSLRVPWYRKREAGPSYHKIYLDILLFFKCISISRRQKYDIIHAHLHEGIFIAWLLKLFRIMRKAPVIADIQGSLVKEMMDHGYLKNRAIRKAFILLEKAIIGMADAVITSSGNAASMIRKDFKKKAIPVPDGVDKGMFRPCKTIDKKSKNKKTKQREKQKTIVFLGLLNAYQGVDVLIKSIPHVIDKYPDVKFLIMGFPNVDKYRNMAEKLGVLQYTKFTGKIDYNEAPEMLCKGDIAVSFKISKTEANGKIFNYIACGLPCVVSDIPVNREILGNSGMYAKPGDPADSARKILSLLKDEPRREKLAQDSLKLSKEYSWEKRAEQVMSIYKDLKKKRGR
ncbi:glycosyltransferase [Candidatus Woesearchaeota archaeon]|nr:glycosyltransferase [Candidatus Woesearchaeota archaeon]